MEAIAERPRLDLKEESELEKTSYPEVVDLDTRFFNRLERYESYTDILMKTGGRIRLEFLNNMVYLTSYRPDGGLGYDFSEKDESDRSSKNILADWETRILGKAEYWENVALERGARYVNNRLNETLERKLYEQKLRANERSASKAQKIVDSLGDITIKS